MILIEKWQGLITNASPYAVPGGGFVEQINIQCLKPGQVESRRGYSASGFTMSSVAVASPNLVVTSLVALPNGDLVAVASGDNELAVFRSVTK